MKAVVSRTKESTECVWLECGVPVDKGRQSKEDQAGTLLVWVGLGHQQGYWYFGVQQRTSKDF